MKILKYLVLITGLAVWAAGLSPGLFSAVGKAGLIQDGYQYGDLYRLSNLSDFKDPRKTCPPYPARLPAEGARKKIHLYIIGDSFTEKQRVSKSDFPVEAYTYVHWADFLHIKLDTTQHNILLLESVERHFRQKMVSPVSVLIPDTATFVTTVQQTKLVHRLDDAFSSRHTEDRLDGLLFQNDLLLTLRQWKADFNHRFFDRVNSGVTLFNNERDMVYYMDTDNPNVTSSYSDLKKTEVDSIVSNLNTSVEFFKNKIGFSEVVLSIIPNKATILAPDYGNYNHLIERVYRHPALKIPVIDVLPAYRKMGRSAYLTGDSHWTCEGRYVWLSKVEKLIRNTAAPDI